MEFPPAHVGGFDTDRHERTVVRAQVYSIRTDTQRSSDRFQSDCVRLRDETDPDELPAEDDRGGQVIAGDDAGVP